MPEEPHERRAGDAPEGRIGGERNTGRDPVNATLEASGYGR
jgi:hypothetical protein